MHFSLSGFCLLRLTLHKKVTNQFIFNPVRDKNRIQDSPISPHRLLSNEGFVSKENF